MKRALFLLGIILVTFPLSSCAQATFECFPEYKISIDETGYDKVILSPKESNTFKTLITAKNNRYYWSSNNDFILYKSRNDNFSTYVNPKGEGYVKIKEILTMPYIEHQNNGLKTITYYGYCK